MDNTSAYVKDNEYNITVYFISTYVLLLQNISYFIFKKKKNTKTRKIKKLEWKILEVICLQQYTHI